MGQAKQTLSTSNIEVNSNDNDDVSTDEEEIDRKLHVLIKRLESKLDNPDKSVSQKQSVKKVLDNIHTKVNALTNKTKRMEIQWDILEPVQNGDVDSSSDSDNDPILTTSSRYKPEKQAPSSDEYSDEEAAIASPQRRAEEAKKKKEAAEKARIQREIDLSEKLVAEETKRRMDQEKQRERLAREKTLKEEKAREKSQKKSCRTSPVRLEFRRGGRAREID